MSLLPPWLVMGDSPCVIPMQTPRLKPVCQLLSWEAESNSTLDACSLLLT